MRTTSLLELVGTGTRVPLVTGCDVPYVGLDLAASAPPLVAVRDAVEELLPWYSSVHRGAGFKSMVSTDALEGAREAVASFLSLRTDDVVVFTRNTTDALNLLASAVPDDVRVIAFETEHHANLLPWARGGGVLLPAPASPADALVSLEGALKAEHGRALVTVTGASNVTGELWPLAEITQMAHRWGARVAADLAQLAPHRSIDVAAWDLDYVAISGHKLYAPYGAGALAGRRDWLDAGQPWLAGGGSVVLVTPDEVIWKDSPDRHEAGSPNVVGAFALGVATRVLMAAGMERVAAHEQELIEHARAGLAEIAGLRRYSLWGDSHPRIGVIAFNLDGFEHDELAAILSAEHGIGVRDGCFCAHPLMLHLLGVDTADADSLRVSVRAGELPHFPGAVRMSVGVGTSSADIDRVVGALGRIATNGPRWQYERDEGGGCVPVDDPRPRPGFLALLT